MTFNIPDEKVKELENMLEKVKGYKNRGHPVRDLAKLVGKIQSLRLATGPIVSVLTRCKNMGGLGEIRRLGSLRGKLVVEEPEAHEEVPHLSVPLYYCCTI